MKVQRELMRGAGPAAVLQLLAARPMYGYQLVEALGTATEGVLAMGQSTLYPLLYNLEGKGLIRGKWTEADSGRKRKVYRLTHKGEVRLEAERLEWGRLVSALSAIGLLSVGEGVS